MDRGIFYVFTSYQLPIHSKAPNIKHEGDKSNKQKADFTTPSLNHKGMGGRVGRGGGC